MDNFLLLFNKNIIELEKRGAWLVAADMAYKLWMANPNNLNCLLCAGTQLWYTIGILNYVEWEKTSQIVIKSAQKDDLMQKLWKITKHGNCNFAHTSAFNIYFGYMLSVQPVFFLNSGLDFLTLRTIGIDKICTAYLIDPANPIVQAIYHNSGVDADYEQYLRICKNIWKDITPEQWGYSQVNQYFFRILNGEYFYPNIYSAYED